MTIEHPTARRPQRWGKTRPTKARGKTHMASQGDYVAARGGHPLRVQVPGHWIFCPFREHGG